MEILESERDDRINRARLRRKLRDNYNPLEMENNSFIKNFRVSKEAFKYILDIIDSKLRRSTLKASIPNIIKLAATLRFFAQGSWQLSVGNDDKIPLAQSTVSVVLTEVFKVLEDNLCHEWIKFNYSETEIQEAKVAFYKRSDFPGIIGCVDGTHIKIAAPKKALQHLYCNAKGFYSLNAMIVCDHKMRIRYINATNPGASDDSMVFHLSALATKLDNMNPRNFWLLGDADYALKPYLMIPFKNAEEGSLEEKYNKKHAIALSIIEGTIDVLKNRFRCLKSARGLHYSPEKATQITNVCAMLHNLCIHYNVESSEFNSGNSTTDVDSNENQRPVRNLAEDLRRKIMLCFI